MKKLIFIQICIVLFPYCTNKTLKKKIKKQNRLEHSQSPYLLQHASNPVDWYPWSEDAFILAKKENKPIFLSIGYSTCHWCHVMEHESFEDTIVAKQMNKNFVNIKVDREEMPEIDHLYMSVCQAMTGRGGWPLTIIMTPDKEPFFAGTYFPKQGRIGQPGMLELIPSIANAWINKQNEIKQSINQIQNYLIKINTSVQGDEWDEDMIHHTYQHYLKQFDPKYGGFGNTPKFPSTHNLIFLIRYSKIYSSATALEMVETTLQSMRRGGIFDHIGLGFHRYSTDEKWFLPHFEKMLYDQAMISIAYLEAYQLTRKKEYADVAKEIFSYVLRVMQDKEGGFYSAEDADSEGEEGTFYIWEEDEIIKILGDDSGMLISKVYNFSKTGNFFDEATGKINGKNIPYLKENLELIAQDLKLSLDSLNKVIHSSREKLFQIRDKRIHPLKDDKILTDWNGLMIAALALGGIVLDNELYLKAAENASKFILSELQENNGRLLKRFRKGEAGLPPHIDDYSFMIWGLLNLYEATSNTKYLSNAISLSEIMVEDFIDENGGFFIGSKNAEKLMVRAKDSYDGAIPSGNSVAVLNFFRIWKISGNTKWRTIANQTLKAFTMQAKKSLPGFTHMMTGFMFDLKKPKELVIVFNSNNHDYKQIIKQIRKHYSPNMVVLLKDKSNPSDIEKISPWLTAYTMIDNKPTYYICENFSCKRPTTNLELALNYIKQY